MKITDYILDATGSTLAIYENGVQKELPIYGINRLGIYSKSANVSMYQLTDHLGNVRAVIKKQGNSAIAIQATDYYPFGMPMPNRQIINGEPYRYAYQGQEKDPETGKEAFQLRLWDNRIGRWLTTDPKGEFSSPYLGMGNNPINKVDPDGGSTESPDDWIRNNNTGKIEWFAGTGEFSTNLALNKWGHDADLTTLSTDFFDPNIIALKMGTEMNRLNMELTLKKLSIQNKIYNAIDFVLPDGTEANIEVDGTIYSNGRTLSGDYTGSYSLFVDSFGETGTAISQGAQSSIGLAPNNLSVSANFNAIYSKRHNRITYLKDYKGEEINISVTVPISIGVIPTGLSFNYLEGETYWGFGIALGTPDTGASVSRTTTFFITN